MHGYVSHFRRVSGPTLLDVADREKAFADHLKMWDRTYGWLIRYLPPGSEILDFGCGPGVFLFWLKHYRNITPVGVDIHPEMIEIARRSLPELEIHCADGIAFLEQHPGRFAGIFALQVFEHFSAAQLEQALRATQQALRPGGFLCLEVPNAANFLGTYHRYLDLTHERIFTSVSLRQLLESGGFQKVQIFSPRPVWILGRLRRWIEWSLHWIVYRTCNNWREKHFGSVLCGAGWKETAIAAEQGI
jgi:SAM-dependent methyltransferase